MHHSEIENPSKTPTDIEDVWVHCVHAHKLWCVCVCACMVAWCVQCHMDALHLYLHCHLCKVVWAGTKALVTLELLYVVGQPWLKLIWWRLHDPGIVHKPVCIFEEYINTKPIPLLLSTGPKKAHTSWRSREVTGHQICSYGTLCFNILLKLFMEMVQQQDKNTFVRETVHYQIGNT